MVRDLIKDIKAAAEQCRSTADNCSNEELSDYIREMAIVLDSFVSVLIKEYDQ